jgi:predicted enzyme related to lactoylglutathione lyase
MGIRDEEWPVALRACFVTAIVCGLLACASHGPPVPSANTPSAGRRVGEFVWQDLMTDDAEKSRKFYEQLFGWTFERTDRLGRPYFIARAGSAAVAGMAQVERRRPDEPIAQWISYLSVSNVDSVAARLTAAGGRVLVAPTDIQASRAAIVVDPQGAPLGLVRLGPNLNPPLGGPSALVCSFLWRDCFAKDVELARTFYSNLVGLAATQQQRPDSLVQYILTRTGPGPVAGVVPIGGRPIKPNWLPYVRVNDPAAVAARAEQLGGRVIVRPSPEIRKGSVAVIVDPSGAAIALQKWPF